MFQPSFPRMLDSVGVLVAFLSSCLCLQDAVDDTKTMAAGRDASTPSSKASKVDKELSSVKPRKLKLDDSSCKKARIRKESQVPSQSESGSEAEDEDQSDPPEDDDDIFQGKYKVKQEKAKDEEDEPAPPPQKVAKIEKEEEEKAEKEESVEPETTHPSGSIDPALSSLLPASPAVTLNYKRKSMSKMFLLHVRHACIKAVLKCTGVCLHVCVFSIKEGSQYFLQHPSCRGHHYLGGSCGCSVGP